MVNSKEIDLLPDQPLGEKLIKKGFWLYFFTFLIAPTGYLIKVIVSNSISVEEVGILYSVIGFVTLLSVYNDLGFTETLKYYVPKFLIKKDYNNIKTSILMSLSLQIFTAGCLILGFFLLSDFLAINYFHSIEAKELLKYFTFYFIGINIFQILQSLYLSFQDTFNNQFVNFIKMWTTLGFTVAFFVVGKTTILSYGVSWIFGLFVALIVSLTIFFYRYRFIFEKGKISFDKFVFKKYFKYSILSFLTANASILLTQIDIQMSIVFLGPKAAGFYTNYVSLLSIGSIIIGPILLLLFPLVSELVSKKQNQKLRILQNIMYTYFSVLSISIGFLLFALGPEVAFVMFGKKFVESGNLLMTGALFMFLSILIGINFNILMGLGKVSDKLKMIGVTSIVNILLNLMFMKYRGLYGIVFSTIIGWIIMFIRGITIINKNEKINFNWTLVIKNFVLISLLAFVIYIFKDRILFINSGKRLTTLFYMLGLIFVYYIILAVFNKKIIFGINNQIKSLRS